MENIKIGKFYRGISSGNKYLILEPTTIGNILYYRCLLVEPAEPMSRGSLFKVYLIHPEGLMYDEGHKLSFDEEHKLFREEVLDEQPTEDGGDEKN